MDTISQSPLMISGPSGIGKNYLAQLLTERNQIFALLPSVTTRSPRQGERDGVEYTFLDEMRYGEVAHAGDFFMDNPVFGKRYGYRTSELEALRTGGKIPVALVYTPVADQFIKAHPDSISMFLKPVNGDFLRDRMRRRGDSSESIERRMVGIDAELAAFEKHRALFQEVVTICNDTSVEEAVARVAIRYHLALSL